MRCNITIRLHVAFWFDWSKFGLESCVQETIHVGGSTAGGGVSLCLRPTRQARENLFSTPERKKKIPILTRRTQIRVPVKEVSNV